jgi:hypothetical protein
MLFHDASHALLIDVKTAVFHFLGDARIAIFPIMTIKDSPNDV